MVDWEVARAEFGGGGEKGKNEVGGEFNKVSPSLTSELVPTLNPALCPLVNSPPPLVYISSETVLIRKEP